MREIDRVRFDDRADRVVEEQSLGAGQPADFFRQRAAGQRAGGDNRDGVIRDRRRLFAPQLDPRILFDRSRNLAREDLAIHRQRMAARHPSRPRRARNSSESSLRSSSLSSHGRRVLRLALQRIAAHQFRQPVRLMRGRRPHRPHFEQHAIQTRIRDSARPLPSPPVRRPECELEPLGPAYMPAILRHALALN